jgi:hypothetical protein
MKGAKRQITTIRRQGNLANLQKTQKPIQPELQQSVQIFIIEKKIKIHAFF